MGCLPSLRSSTVEASASPLLFPQRGHDTNKKRIIKTDHIYTNLAQLFAAYTFAMHTSVSLPSHPKSKSHELSDSSPSFPSPSPPPCFSCSCFCGPFFSSFTVAPATTGARSHYRRRRGRLNLRLLPPMLPFLPTHRRPRPGGRPISPNTLATPLFPPASCPESGSASVASRVGRWSRIPASGAITSLQNRLPPYIYLN